jgi:two-component system, NtrC family, sensor kinase
LRTLLEAILPRNTTFNDYEVTHDFERIGPRTILLNARRLDHLQLILLAMEDITARKHAEAQLQQQQAHLERQVQERTAALHREMAERQRLEREAQRAQHFALLGRLAAGLSHEIRNPLAAIFLHVDVLEEELRDPSPKSAEIAQAFTEIKTNLARLDDLLQDYLSLVRVGTARLSPGDLQTVVTQLAQEMTPALAAQGITLQLDGLDQLGRVPLHQNTFRRVLLNLVHNAMEAMPQGGTLTLRGHQQAATVSLDIRDTGSGIPPEHYTQIFEPLHTTKPGGTGLGLYIVQEVMAAHGGQVAVQSTVGSGTTFTITLPLAGT